MAEYTVNKRAVAHARKLVDARQYVLDSDWGERQPRANNKNRYLEVPRLGRVRRWHLGLTDRAADETKARYAFVDGDSGASIEPVDRLRVPRRRVAAQGGRNSAHDLLQQLDKVSGPHSNDWYPASGHSPSQRRRPPGVVEDRNLCKPVSGRGTIHSHDHHRDDPPARPDPPERRAIPLLLPGPFSS